MRLAALDVGSNSVKLQIVDAYPGAPPLPIFAVRAPLRLVESLDDRGALAPSGVKTLVAAVHRAVEVAHAQGVSEIIGFSTSALREATNGDDVRQTLEHETGLAISTLAARTKPD